MILTKEILRDSPMWQEIENEARAFGEAEGQAKGKAEGKAEGERRALNLILTRRFGPIPPAIDARIAAASLDTLERWIGQAVVADTLDATFD